MGQEATDQTTDGDEEELTEDKLGELFDKHIGESGDDDRDERGPITAREESGEEEDDDDRESDEDAPGEESEEDRDDEGAEGADDREEEDEEEELEADDTFKSAAERNGLPISLKDIPKEARPLVQKRLKEMEAGFTRAMQGAREYRAKEAEWRGERQFIEEHPADFILELYNKNPALIAEVDKQLERLEDPEFKRMRMRDIAHNRRDSQDKASRSLSREERANAVEDYARRQAQAEGVPFDLIIEPAIANELLSRPAKERDITNEEIDTIVKGLARKYRKATGQQRRVEKQTYNRDKVRDRKQTGALARLNRRSTGDAGVERGRPPKSLEEALERRARRVAPDMPDR